MAREGLRKRRQPISDNLVAAGVNGNPSNKKIKLTRKDPITHLNFDIVSILLSFLPPVDLARCECVSRVWRDTVRDFSARSGTRLHFVHLWNPTDAYTEAKDQQYEEYKRFAKYHHTLSTGKPSSVFKFNNVFEFLPRGKFVAWTTRFHCDAYQIHWRSLERSEDGSFPAPKMFFVSAFPVAHRRPDTDEMKQVRFIDLHGFDMNQDGILLLRFRSCTGVRSWDSKTDRNTIYSPADGKVLWENFYNRNAPVETDFVPTLLGKDRAYEIRIVKSHSTTCPRDEYLLSAREFRTDKVVYQSGRPRYYNTTDAYSLIRRDTIRLVTTNNGDEIVLCQPSSYMDHIKDYYPLISVIDASNGHLLRNVKPYLTNLADVSTHLGVKSASYTSYRTWDLEYPENLDDPEGDPTALKDYSIALVERFSGQMADFFSPLPAYVILSPLKRDGRVLMHKPRPDAAALGAAACYPLSTRPDSAWNIPTYSTVLTRDKKLRDAVEAKVKYEFPSYKHPIGDIFLLTETNSSVTLPQRGKRQSKRTQLKFRYMCFPDIEYTDQGQLLLNQILDGNPARYLLNFD